MDWHSLAMKRTALRRAGLGAGSGEATLSSERMEDRMWRTQARQRSRNVSSTAAASVKRSKEDAVGPLAGPEFDMRTEEVSEPAG